MITQCDRADRGQPQGSHRCLRLRAWGARPSAGGCQACRSRPSTHHRLGEEGHRRWAQPVPLAALLAVTAGTGGDDIHKSLGSSCEARSPAPRQPLQQALSCSPWTTGPLGAPGYRLVAFVGWSCVELCDHALRQVAADAALSALAAGAVSVILRQRRPAPARSRSRGLHAGGSRGRSLEPW